MLVVTELSSLASPSVILMDTSKVFVNVHKHYVDVRKGVPVHWY